MDVDDTLVLILERIVSPVSLVRAASTCRRWRRLITDAGFLRRYRALHGPPVAGNYYNHSSEQGVIPSFVPSPSSTIYARHFSLYFLAAATIFPPLPLPQPWHYYHTTFSWKVRESRGSLLLMEYARTRPPTLFPDVVVCEPLTRRYMIIPPPPDFDISDQCPFLGPYLVDDDEGEAGGRIGMSNFRVQCVLFSDDGVAHTTVFAAGAGGGFVWSNKAIDHIASRLDPSVAGRVYWHWFSLGRVLDSWYFYVHRGGTLVTRDCSTGKFSSSVMSDATRKCWDRHVWGLHQNFFVIDGGDGEPRVVTLKDNIMEVFARSDGEWALEKKVLLFKVICGLPGYQPSFVSSKPLALLKRGVGFIAMESCETRPRWRFSIDLKTMEVAPAPEARRELPVYQFEFPWPKVLQACFDR